MNEIIEKKQKTPLYKDTITDLNRLHRGLMHKYKFGDTRAVYLKEFELALSMNCPNQSLWSMERYVRISQHYPLPKDVQSYIGRDLFFLYMMLYEYIMRDIGLIGRKNEEPPTTKVFDLND